MWLQAGKKAWNYGDGRGGLLEGGSRVGKSTGGVEMSWKVRGWVTAVWKLKEVC